MRNRARRFLTSYANASDASAGAEAPNEPADMLAAASVLYDTMMDAEEVEQRERETTREVPLGTILAQTGLAAASVMTITRSIDRSVRLFLS